jgi:hypothetical protein
MAVALAARAAVPIRQRGAAGPDSFAKSAKAYRRSFIMRRSEGHSKHSNRSQLAFVDDCPERSHSNRGNENSTVVSPRLKRNRVVLAATGALSLIFGALIMPGVGLDILALTWPFALYAILLGIFLVAIARRLRQLAQETAPA